MTKSLPPVIQILDKKVSEKSKKTELDKIDLAVEHISNGDRKVHTQGQKNRGNSWLVFNERAFRGRDM